MSEQCDFAFLCDGELSFLFSSLKDMAESKGLNVIKLNIDMASLNDPECIPKAYVVYAQMLNNNVGIRVFLYDRCVEMGTRLVIVGEAADVDLAIEKVSNRIVVASFKRPINNQGVAESMVNIANALKNSGKRKNILIVDDSPLFLRAISAWLLDEYAVDVCTSATSAFHMIDVERPDLILLDYEMPVCNGGRFLKMLKSEPALRSIPVMFLTSRCDKETVETLLALKPDGYLLKTMPKGDILNAIERLFESKEL